MNFVIYYGSTRKQNMKKVLSALTDALNKKGHTYLVFDSPVSFCNSCRVCEKTGHCCIKDDFPEETIRNSDGVIILSPIFFFSFSAKAKAFLDRLFSINLDGKIVTAITLSGSAVTSIYCGFDIIKEILLRTSYYCGSKVVQPINFVTEDRELKEVDKSVIDYFVENLGGVTNEAEKGRKV